MRNRVLSIVLGVWTFVLTSAAATVVQADRSAPRFGEGLHFSHPLVAESPSPDKKGRIDFFLKDAEEDGGSLTESLYRLEGEYAFHRTFSIEFDVPYVVLDVAGGPSQSAFGDLEVSFKFANFAFEDRGLLLGYGLELGLPTGNDAKGIGSDNILEFEPYLAAGYQRGGLQTVGFLALEIPTNQTSDQDDEDEAGYNLSLLYKAAPRVATLVEFDGETVLAGPERGNTIVHLTPGIKIRPMTDSPLNVGLGVGFPITSRKDYDVRVVLSAFYHF